MEPLRNAVHVYRKVIIEWLLLKRALFHFFTIGVSTPGSLLAIEIGLKFQNRFDYQFQIDF